MTLCCIQRVRASCAALFIWSPHVQLHVQLTAVATWTFHSRLCRQTGTCAPTALWDEEVCLVTKGASARLTMGRAALSGFGSGGAGSVPMLDPRSSINGVTQFPKTLFLKFGCL